MEEKVRMPDGFFDKDKLLVDQDIENPFEEAHPENAVQTYPYEDGQFKGYIRYIIHDKSVIILNCVITTAK